jgi:hypothetical protein
LSLKKTEAENMNNIIGVNGRRRKEGSGKS